MSEPAEAAATRASARLVRWGWTLLFVWTFGGLLLESAHAFKWAPFFATTSAGVGAAPGAPPEITRLLLRLAHAHGVGLALVTLLLSHERGRLFAPRPAQFVRVAALVRFAAVTMPLGFAAGAIAASEADPSAAIVLVPFGAGALLVALCWTAVVAWRTGQ